MSDTGSARTVVKTYVPAYQREEWDDHADRLEMSRSEFVRSMVQAGRRGFEGSSVEPTEQQTTDEAAVSGTADMETAVLEALSEAEYRSWDELRALVSEALEERLEETLQELQSGGEIQHSPRQGGYRLDNER